VFIGGIIMGWCSGSYLADDIYNIVRKYIPKNKRKEIANKIYDMFCDQDADSWKEDMNIIKDHKID
jgi:hypothetical protein